MDTKTLLQKLGDGMTAGRSFGPAHQQDGVTVIPVAYVAGGGGGGEDPGANGGEPATGGGWGGVSWPLGAYVIKDGDVRWVPAIDIMRIVLAVLAIVKLGVKLRAVRR